MLIVIGSDITSFLLQNIFAHESREGRSLRRDDTVLESDLSLQRQLLPSREAVRFPCRNRPSTSPRQNHTPLAMSCVIVCVMTILCEALEKCLTRGAVHSRTIGKSRRSAQVLLHLSLQLLNRSQHHRLHDEKRKVNRQRNEHNEGLESNTATDYHRAFVESLDVTQRPRSHCDSAVNFAVVQRPLGI